MRTKNESFNLAARKTFQEAKKYSIADVRKRKRILNQKIFFRKAIKIASFVQNNAKAQITFLFLFFHFWYKSIKFICIIRLKPLKFANFYNQLNDFI